MQPRRPRILVVGDVMLDRYLWGDVDHISFEAPIPVLCVDHREDRLGGAGSVVAILSALEADVVLASVTGDDPEGTAVRELLRGLGVPTDCVLASSDRPTTVKERILGRTQNRHPQQMIRVDRESTAPIGDRREDELLGRIQAHLEHVDLVLVSDYAKGVCAGDFVPWLVAAARQFGLPVIVDPARGVDYRRYSGCACITPNRMEAGLALGTKIDSPEAGLEAARRLLDLGIETVVVKLDRDGMAWADARGRSGISTVKARQVYDITGAGDAVLSALGLTTALGADWPEAIELANGAVRWRCSGWEWRRLRAELLDELALAGFSTGHKIVSLDRLREELRDRRRARESIVMTNGCFDLLHPGHVASLQFARSQGDCLVVGLNSDRSVRSLKGPGLPIVDQQGRAEMLAAIGCVDYVVIFDDSSVLALIDQVRPDVLVKSDQYAPEQVVGHDLVASYGGRIVLAPMKGHYSTSRLIATIRAADHGRDASGTLPRSPLPSASDGTHVR